MSTTSEVEAPMTAERLQHLEHLSKRAFVGPALDTIVELVAEVRRQAGHIRDLRTTVTLSEDLRNGAYEAGYAAGAEAAVAGEG